MTRKAAINDGCCRGKSVRFGWNLKSPDDDEILPSPAKYLPSKLGTSHHKTMHNIREKDPLESTSNRMVSCPSNEYFILRYLIENNAISFGSKG